MKQSLLLFLGASLFFFAPFHQANAHAAPVLYEPASASLISQVPQTVRIRFSERIDPGASSISVYAPDGTEIDDHASSVDAADPYLFSTGFHAAGSGTYTVAWQVISADDGHFTKGGFIFSVGKESRAENGSEGQFQVQHRSDWPEAITIWIELLGEAILLGCLVVILAVWRPMKKILGTDDSRRILARRMRILIWVAGFLVLLGGSCYLLLESSNLALDQGGVTFGNAFHAFLTTITGRFTLYRMLAGAIATLTFALSLRSILGSDRFTKKEFLLFVFLVFIDLLRARVSHAAASLFLPTFSIFVNAVHLVFKDVWIGGLVALVFAILPILKTQRDARLAALALLSFSNLLMLALAFGGVSGVYVVWLHLKSPVNLLMTHWGTYFITLGGFASVLLCLRIFEQRVINPSLVLFARGKADPERTENAGMAGPLLAMEMLVGLAALLYSSILIITTPPLSPQHFYERTVVTSNAAITFGEHHEEDDQFLVTVIRKNQPQTDTGETMTVTLENQEKNIGPLVAKTEERFPGGFVFAKQNLSPGLWKINVTEQEPHQFDAVASFTFNYPTDISAVHQSDAGRTFGWFEAMLSGIALLILLLALWLYKKNKSLQSRLNEDLHEKTLPAGAFGNLWAAMIFGLLVVIFIGFSLGHNHGAGGMAQACTLAGGQWHENVPMRNGKATSTVAGLGCMLGAGQGTFHFIDPREFAFFTRPGFAYATMKTDPAKLQPGKPVTLLFHIQDTNGNPVTRLTLEHDRLLHVIVVSQDFQTFAHLHVEDTGPVTPQMLTDATFPVRYTFPKPGTYLIAVDYTIGAKTLADTFRVNVGSGSMMQQLPIESDPEQTAGGMQARLVLPKEPVTAGTIQTIRYRFEEDGTPVTNLQPYLSAAMHLSIVAMNLRTFVHTHAELPQTFLDSIFTPRDPTLTHVHMFLPDRFGPDLVAYVLFPVPGEYELFGEVIHNGKIVTTRFMVKVK